MKGDLFIFTDGGARGNPGPAAIGFIVKDNKGKVLKKEGKCLGKATNNIAEYQAVIEALKWIKDQLTIKRQPSTINFFLDSRLIVNQLNGLFKIKNHGLRQLIVEVRKLEQAVGGNVAYHFVPREKNRDADALVNQALNSNIL
jgi:ribonuclease HI